MDLSGELMTGLSKDPDPFKDLREIAKSGKPQILIDSEGRELGKWVLTSLDETHDHFSSDGIPRKIAFRMALTRVHEE